MGMFSTIFRKPTNRRFDFTPRYYDEVKERQKKRFAELEREKQMKEDGTYVKRDLKGSFRAQHEQTAKIKHRSNGRLVIIMAVLLVLAYYLLYK